MMACNKPFNPTSRLGLIFNGWLHLAKHKISMK